MSRKKILVISVALALILIFILGYFLFLQNGSGNPGTGSIFKNLFPFGQNNGSNNGNGNGNGNGDTNGTGQNGNGDNTAANFNQKLRKLSSEPVAGAGLIDSKAGTTVR